MPNKFTAIKWDDVCHMVCHEDDCGATFSVYTNILHSGYVIRRILHTNEDFIGECPACGSQRIFTDTAREEE